MVRSLPAKPSLRHLRNQAQDLLKQHRAGDREAIGRFRQHPRFTAAESPAKAGLVPSLSDAQLVIAREYGFASWPRLKQHVEVLEQVQERVDRLRASFATADPETRERLLSCVHTRSRFQHYEPTAETLSEEDARLVVANAEGYAFWGKYESYLLLDPTVQRVIKAARIGDLKALRAVLRAAPGAANPRWARPEWWPSPIPNDSIPLHCVAEGVFNGSNRQRNDYALARVLIEAGAEVDIEGGTPLLSAVSYGAGGAVLALLEGGAAVDGVRGDGAPLAYALHFGFTGIAGLLARYHAKLDLRFAAGLGNLEVVRSYFLTDGTLKPGAGDLADPYENRFRCDRTPANVLAQALYFACLHGRLEVAEYLLRHGADVNAEVPGLDTQEGVGTPLHHLSRIPVGASADAEAIERERLAVARLLLDHGANVRVRDSAYQSTPLGWATHFGREEIARLLRMAGGGEDS